jgi:hypothetical protein
MWAKNPERGSRGGPALAIPVMAWLLSSTETRVKRESRGYAKQRHCWRLDSEEV